MFIQYLFLIYCTHIHNGVRYILLIMNRYDKGDQLKTKQYFPSSSFRYFSSWWRKRRKGQVYNLFERS